MHEITIVARGGVYPFSSARTIVTIEVEDVGDNRPVFGQMEYNISVPESRRIGSALLTLSASTADSFSLFYTIVGGWGEENFEVNSTTGVITLSRLLRYVKQTFHRVIVRASNDGGLLFAETTLTVNVEDEQLSPLFTEVEYRFRIPPTPPIGQVLGYVFANDGDNSCGLPIEDTGLLFSVPNSVSV